MLIQCCLMFMTLSILWITNVTSQNLNAKGPRHKKSVTDCLQQISLVYFVPRKSLLTVVVSKNLTSPAYEIQEHLLQQMNMQSHWFLEVVEGGSIPNVDLSVVCINCSSEDRLNTRQLTEKQFSLEYKSKFILVITDTFDNFKIILGRITTYKSFDLRAKVLVYISKVCSEYKNIINSVIDVLWTNKIFKFVVVIPQNNPLKLQAYSLKIYEKAKECGQNPSRKLIYTCSNGKLTNKYIFFNYDIPKNFQGCKLKAITVKYPPFVIDENKGFETKLIKELGRVMHINFVLYLDNRTTSWGTKNFENNIWSGRLGYVQNNSAIGFGSVQYSSEIVEDFDVTTGYFYEHIVWIVPAAEPYPEWQCLFQILTFKVWIAFGATYVIGTVALYLILLKEQQERFKYDLFLHVSTVSWQMLIGSSLLHQPSALLSRIIFCSIVIGNLILSTFYQSSLIYPLTHTVYYSQIETLQGILDSDLNIGGLGWYKNFFNVTHNTNAMKIYNMYKTYSLNDTAHSWLKIVNDEKNTATPLGEFYVKYLVANSTSDEYSKVFILKEKLMFYPVHIVLPKGFPLRDRFDTIISRMVCGGLIHKWMTSYTQKLKQFEQLKKQSAEGHYNMPVSIHKIQGAFVLLMIGNSLATMAFLSEILVYKCKLKLSYKSRAGIRGQFQVNDLRHVMLRIFCRIATIRDLQQVGNES